MQKPDKSQKVSTHRSINRRFRYRKVPAVSLARGQHRRMRRIPIMEKVERRRRDRRACVIAVRIATPQAVFLCQSADISPGGISLRRVKDIPLPEGTPALVEFNLPGEEGLVRVLGKIVRDHAGDPFRESAVAFHPHASGVRSRIRRFSTK